MSHTREALTSGAAAEEIIHSVLLALSTTGFPNMIAAMGWAEGITTAMKKLSRPFSRARPPLPMGFHGC